MADARYIVPYEADLGIPTVVLNNDKMADLVKWFATNLIRNQPVVGVIPNHFVMDWYGLSQEKLTDMQNVAPNLSYIRRYVHGLRHLLQICEIQSVKVVAKKDLISQAILVAHPTA